MSTPPQRPSRRELLQGTAAISLAGCGGPPRPAPRNVVLVLVDDQRADAFSFRGHPFLETPRLDRLAAEGAVCSNALVTTSLCCPSRASMLTGLYAHAHGVLDNQSELSAAIPTYAQLLSRAGRSTAYVGKWHMGAENPHPRPGWSRWVGFRGQGRYTYPGPPRLDPLDRGFSYDGELRPVRGYVTDLLTDEAVAFLEAQTEADPPFCLVLAHKACHAPFQAAPRHAGAYADAPAPPALPNTDAAYAGLPDWLRRMRDTPFGVERPYGTWPSFEAWYRAYHRTLLAVDESVGRVVDALDRTGLAASTVLLYTSDNGFMHGEKGVLDKRNAYETSIRVPLIARGPGIPAGHRVREMVLNVDLAPTVLDLLGVPAPTGWHGRSARPLLEARPAPDWRQDMLYTYFHERRFPTTPTVIALRTATHKLVTYHGVPDGPELYDLRADPEERRNLAPTQPKLQRALTDQLVARAEALGLRTEPVWGARWIRDVPRDP